MILEDFILQLLKWVMEQFRHLPDEFEGCCCWWCSIATAAPFPFPLPPPGDFADVSLVSSLALNAWEDWDWFCCWGELERNPDPFPPAVSELPPSEIWPLNLLTARFRRSTLIHRK